MAYDAKNSEVVIVPPATVVDGVIIAVNDGKPEDFVKGDAAKKFGTRTCIQVIAETKWQGRAMRARQLFSYEDVDGKTTFSKKSKLGSYHAQYGKLPEVGDKVKLISDAEGYFDIMIAKK